MPGSQITIARWRRGGRRAAKAIGRYLRDSGIEPELVLCSSATRAQETLERTELAGPRVRVEPGLYGAGADALLAHLQHIPPDVRSVMLIGHNPGLQQLALLLVRPGPELEALAAKFPTAALATLAISSWDALGRGTANLTDFVRPRDLER